MHTFPVWAAGELLEFGGDCIQAMDLAERGVLCNMAAELGAETGIVPADAMTIQALQAAGRSPAADALDWRGDADADVLAVHDFDAAALVPQVAAPHSPANSGPVEQHAGTPVDQAYIGACVGAKLEDLRMVAQVLRGLRVASGTRLLVAPASQRAYREAAADGSLAAISEAGAYLLPTGCGACAALGAGILAEDEVCISSTNRNFQGRMGANSAEVYLASPYTVAASAITGRITDPREFLS